MDIKEISNKIALEILAHKRRQRLPHGKRFQSLIHSIEILIRDSVSLKLSGARKVYASINKGAGHYSQSRYNSRLSYSTNATSSVGNINRLWTVWSQSTGTICTSVCTSVRNLLVMEKTYYRYMYLQDGQAGTIPLYVGIIQKLLHREAIKIIEKNEKDRG